MKRQGFNDTFKDIMPGCWKVPYRSKSEAQRELKRLQRSKYAGGQMPTRVYECPEQRCGKWHLTSAAKKPWWKT